MDLDKFITEILLEDQKNLTMAPIDRQTKVLKATGHLATTEARRRNDPLYKKMLYHRELYYKYRELLHQKYGPSVRHMARG